ncbi:hypothetical protein HK102_001460 [Quaeritorhiza haematococci]|nr:hypothetical protein HK102_001460 [Quaeritorhiza haematococci]
MLATRRIRDRLAGHLCTQLKAAFPTTAGGLTSPICLAPLNSRSLSTTRICRSADPPAEQADTATTSAAPATNTGPTLSHFNVLETAAGTKMITGVRNQGFSVGDVNLVGPVLLVNNSLLMWDVPQFAVGSEEVVPTDQDLERGYTEVDGEKIPMVTDETSVFYGWTTKIFDVFKTIEPLPGEFCERVLWEGAGLR